MLVAIVTAVRRPARLTISASCWWNFALRTVWMIPARFSIRDRTSEASTLVVPTSTGCPLLLAVSISRRTALYLSRRALKIESFLSVRMHGLLVGITWTERR